MPYTTQAINSITFHTCFMYFLENLLVVIDFLDVMSFGHTHLNMLLYITKTQ